jgi:catalase
MLIFTKWFGVTETDAERNRVSEQSVIDEIAKNILAMQSKAAKDQNRPLRRGTHAKGICVKAQFEVFQPDKNRSAEESARLARGIFALPGKYNAMVRFANADSNVNPDAKPDVRSLSFSVDMNSDVNTRQDFSMQNCTILPINDSSAFLAITKVLIASNPGKGLLSLSLKDKMRVFRTLALTKKLEGQPFKAYQQLRYHSNTPFRHGEGEYVKYSLSPSSDNKSDHLDKKNKNCLQDDLIKQLQRNTDPCSFDFGIQFLDIDKMTYHGKHYDENFWLENASVEWHESEAPFYNVARLTLIPNSALSAEEGEKISFDVRGNALPESEPVGSINRARQRGDLASRNARITSY